MYGARHPSIARHLLVALALTTPVAGAAGQQHPVITVGDEPPVWHLDPLAVIVTPDSVGFTRVGGVLFDPRGGVIVLDMAEKVLYRFDDHGHLIGTIGRIGSGPSEFRSPEAIGWLGDELIVYDPGNARIVRWDRHGGYHGQWSLTLRETGDIPIFAGRNGTVWLYQFGRGPSGALQANFTRIPPGGSSHTIWLPPRKVVETHGPPAGHDGYVVCVYQDGFSWFDSPFWTAPSKQVITWQGQLLRTSGPDYRLVVTNATGDTVKELIHDVPRAPITDAEWTAGIADYRAWSGKHPEASCTGRESRARAKPAIRDLATDDSGRVWVERYMPTGFQWEAWEGNRIVGAFAVADTAENVKTAFNEDRVAFVRYRVQDGGYEVRLYRIRR